MSEPGFGRKQIGWGWSPRTWRGYAVVAVVLLVAIAVERFAA